MPPTNLPVPADPAGLTPQWLTAVLAATSPGAFVSQVATERCGADFGLFSEVYRCVLTGRQAPASVVVKLWDTAAQASGHEVDFYREFAPGLPLRLPRCFHAAADAATLRGVLVLEDLRGARQGDCLEAFDTPAALAFAGDLARLHAAWWDSPRLGAPWLPRSGPLQRDHAWHTERRPRALERFGAALDPLLRRCIEHSEVVQALSGELLADAAPTLLHNDLHLDNVLFLPPDAAPALLDWARCCAGPAACDLCELAFAMARPEDGDTVLAAYSAELLPRLGPRLTADGLRRQLAGAILRRSLVSTMGTVNWQPGTARGERIIAVNLARQGTALRWLRSTQPELLS
jgi:fructosamine-3-kinase